MLKLLVLCCSLADTDLTAAKMSTLQQQFAVLTMLLGPLSFKMEIVTRCDAPRHQKVGMQLTAALKVIALVAC